MPKPYLISTKGNAFKAFKLIFCVLLSAQSFGQAPNITYTTPQTYVINKTITPLQPVNTGGTVPATIYGQISTIASGFNNATGVAIDAVGNIYAEDWGNNQIKKISPTGVMSVFAGSGSAGSANGLGASASFYEPDGIVIDVAGNLYIADQGNHLIRKITPASLVTTFAGNGTAGATNGPGSAASFNNPRGLAMDAAGNIYVADQGNNLIRKITPAGVVSTVAGSGATGFLNGSGSIAIFNKPTGVEIDASGTIYIADAGNNAIRRISGGLVSTVVSGLNFPREVRVDGTGNLYVSDQDSNTIKRISSTGVVTTIATSLNGPLGLVLDGNGNLYVGDDYSGQIKKIIISGYTIDKALPPGFVFDPRTGIISGTPTTLSPAANYTITAYNGGGSNSTAINIEVLAVAPLKPSIINFPIPTTTNVDANDILQTGVTSTNNETPVTYTTSDPSIAYVGADGQIHVVAPGIITVTAFQNGNSNYTAATPVSRIFSIIEYFNVTLPAIAEKNTCDADFQVSPDYFPPLPINYASSDPNVATIDAQGIVHITGVGTTIIKAYQNSNPPLYIAVNAGLATLTVKLPVVPTVNIAAAYASPCAGSQLTFTATTSNGGTTPSYQWQVNNINAGNNAPVFMSSALNNDDKVNCIVTNNNTACLATFPVTSNIVTVSLIEPSTPFVSIKASVNYVYPGTLITFTADVKNAIGTVSYQWQVNGVDEGTNNPVFNSNTFINGDVVTCNITQSTACSTPTSSNILTVNIVSKLTIPNTFTPNGDGINDAWNIIGIANYPDCLVTIYNRYGALIYQSTGYGEAWDGIARGGGQVPVGTYYYVITDKVLPEKLSGSLTVIR